MAHYAKVENGVVTNVLVAEQDFVDTQAGTWVQTSYNTHGGQHTFGGTPLRKNYAGIGYTYDSTRDAFIHHSLTQVDAKRNNLFVEPPTERPADGKFYVWNEDTTSWVEDAEGATFI